MAPHIGSMEILLLAMLALVVMGPRDLPVLLRKLGQWVGSARAMADEFRAGIEEMGREADVQAMQDEVNTAVMEVQGALDDVADSGKNQSKNDQAGLGDIEDDRIDSVPDGVGGDGVGGDGADRDAPIDAKESLR